MNKDLQYELELMEAYHLLAHKNADKNPYAVPDGYFLQKQEQLMDIASQRQGHKVPEGYFDQLTDKVMSRIDSLEEEKQPVLAVEKPIPSTPKRNIRQIFTPFSTVAAAVALLLASVFWLSKPGDSVNQPQFAEIISETFDEEELAFLYDDGEVYMMEALYEDFDVPEAESEQLLDPLFQEDEMSFDSLFYL